MNKPRLQTMTFALTEQERDVLRRNAEAYADGYIPRLFARLAAGELEIVEREASK